MTHNARFDALPDLLTKEQLADLLQVNTRTVEGWRTRKFESPLEQRALTGVRFAGAVRYPKSAVLDYIEAVQAGDVSS